MLALLTVLGVLIAGYHPGCEDDGVYLSAIKRDLNPALYPHDSDFFALQLQATVFDKAVAGLVRFSRIPVDVVILALHVLTIFFVLWGCLRIARRCFKDPAAQWLGVALVAVLLTLPVAGTALYLIDQNLHPRAMATAAILFAITAVLDRKWTLASVLLIAAAVFHPMMAAYGISFSLFLAWNPAPAWMASESRAVLVSAVIPLGWIFEPASSAWHVAANTRGYYFLSRWEWYEWLGVFAPLGILWGFRWIGQRTGNEVLARLSTRLVFYAVLQFIVAVVILDVPGFARLRSFQPMRFLHLLYLLMALLGGGLLGQWLQRRRQLRWAALLVPLAVVMFFAQRQTYAATEHLELPGAALSNPWLAAFDWIRLHTPVDGFFAVGPHYMERPGEDYHSFRAMAERSSLADVTKDASVATQVPSLAPVWLEQVEAQLGWENFGPTEFEHLHAQFGVDWLVIEKPGGGDLDCPYENAALRVCRIDATRKDRGL